MHTDPIADMLTRIRNAVMARHSHTVVPTSRMKVAIARILKDEGYIEDFYVTRDRPKSVIRIRLKYAEGRQPVLTGLRRISKPGRRIYTRKKDIPWVRSGMGVAILSTPKGVMTGQQAKRLGVGGEILCYIW